jgi:hypothetical protein
MTNGYTYHHRWFPDVDGRCHYWSNSRKYGVANINNNNTCNNDGCLGKDTIICWAGTRQWFHSPCYWNVWVISFLFWFIFYHFCTEHYCTSSTIFFSLFNACFLLLTTHVQSLAVCINHNDSSTGCYIWSGFFIFSIHHSYCTFVINRFVENDNFFVLGLLCYYWLSFRSHESSLHSVFI